MNIKDDMEFYLKIIPALSSPDWQYIDNPSFHDVMAWHRLNISDPDIGIRGRIGINNTGTSTNYFVRLDNGEGCYPGFMETAPIRLGVFESYTKPIVQPTFPELEADALRVAHQLIAKKKAGWIEKRNDWLEQTNTMK